MKKLTRKIHLALFSPALLIATAFSNVNIGQAQTSALKIVGRDAATNATTNLQVWSGRSSVIDFSQTGEVIMYIRLADPSRAVFNTDAELKTNQARTIFVQPIQPLQFPGATTANITNLFVKTRSPEGIERLYTFNVVHRDGQPTNNGIAISTVVPGQEPSVTLADNRTAAIGDIERGLDIAILRGYTPPNDPVVFKVREFIALARNGTAIAKAAEKTNLSMSVVISLGQLGISRELLFGTPQTPSPSLPSNSNLLNSNPRKP